MDRSEKRREKRRKTLENRRDKFETKLRAVETELRGTYQNLREDGSRVKKKTQTFWNDFKKFVAKGNVIDLAVAIIVGAAFNKVVNTIVSSIITPLTSMLLPSGNFTTLKWVLREAVPADEAAGIAAVEEVAVTYGLLIEAIIDFLIISLTLFVIIRTFLRVKTAMNAKELEAEKAKKAAEEKKKKEEEQKKADELKKIREDFIDDVSVQADELREIKQILLRMEQKNQSL